LPRTSQPYAIQLPVGGPPELLSDRERATLMGDFRDGYSLAVGIGRLLRSWAAGPETRSSARRACRLLVEPHSIEEAWSRCCRQLTRLKRLLDPGGCKPKILPDAWVWKFISTRDDIESLLVAFGVAASRVNASDEEILQVTESESAIFIATGELDALVEKRSRFRSCPPLAWTDRKNARRLSAITSHPGDAYWVGLGMELTAANQVSS
jgi:hypothetical protein